MTYLPRSSDVTNAVITLTARNGFDHGISVAVIVYNTWEEDWHVRGWYAVKPGQKEEFKISATDGSNFYVHVITEGGKALTTKGDRLQTVSDNIFFYLARAGLNEGTNLRVAKFEKLPVKDGAASLTVGP